MTTGLNATAACWEPLEQVYGWIHQLAQVLDETHQMSLEERQLQFAVVLLSIQEHAASLGASFQQAIAHLCKVTASYAPHLFFCYQIPDLPRTNNDLEQAFGQVRSHERRATGRRGAVPALVVQGTVRLRAALATRLHAFTAEELAPHDLQVWRQVRAQVSYRQEARCKQYRFRKDPATYLAALEAQLLKTSLRS